MAAQLSVSCGRRTQTEDNVCADMVIKKNTAIFFNFDISKIKCCVKKSVTVIESKNAAPYLHHATELFGY